MVLAIAAGILLVTLGDSSTAVAGDETRTPFHLAALEAGDPASGKEVPFLRQDFLADSGHDLSSARLLATNAAGSHVIAITRRWNGQNQLCVIVTDANKPLAGAGACGSAVDFNKYGMFVTLSRGYQETDEVVGLLPDGVTSVVVHSAKSDRTIRVERNTVRFAHQGATSATLDGPSGPVESAIAGGLDE